MPIIGIDLGTTNSLACCVRDGSPVIIPNSFGDHLTPSIVSVDADGQVLTGKIAAERRITDPFNTASVFKRAMGTKREYALGARTFLPEELSSFIVRKLKEDAEAFLGEPVEEVVISTPAYFNDAQRRATKAAGELAGVRVERIVSEPTSAAIAYGLHERPEHTRFLVFDLGGGTFDVSVLEFTGEIMEVCSVAGDNFLGGEDFTMALAQLFAMRKGIDLPSLDARNYALLRQAAETAKVELSEKASARMQYQPTYAETPTTLEVYAEEFRAACEPTLERLKTPIVRALADADLGIQDVDNIILVGGATKMPVVRMFVGKLFGQFPLIGIDPDEAVAVGVGVQAAMKERNEGVKEMILTDVCPFTLGTEILMYLPNGLEQSGIYSPIIERNTVIPVSRAHTYYTSRDGQEEIRIPILQGESRLAADNILLGELSTHVPPGPGGAESVEVRFTYDINGILEVEVTVNSTGEKVRTVIEKNPGMMSQEEIEGRLAKLADLKVHSRDRDEYRLLRERGARLYEEARGRLREEISKAMTLLDAVLGTDDPAQIGPVAANVRDFLDQVERSRGF
ncbi:MAG: molecular chaperone HscC [Clostridiales Family XIII bacterium]|jgi:molecular chaperone HscC|nr:molecular chaperone HscC [Clostridiales Family XIII bacterium]